MADPAAQSGVSSPRARGRLKIFFGAAAGVGKTCAMLQAAQWMKQDGVDVAIGVVETHGWPETAALCAGLESVPMRKVEYRGAHIQEFDLDAAIARRPQLILIDELAHANTPSSRHAKRWQDVQELLEAGIGVYTTLSVLHVESLTNIIERITGVDVRETVPDSVLERADSLELVDRNPEELLKRLHSAGAQVARPADGVVGLNQLIALRELALRMTADRVHAQNQAMRATLPGAVDVATAERLLVCIGPNPLSARLVRSARRMAASLQAEWVAVYVETPDHKRLSEGERRHVIQNMRLAELLGAETVSLSGTDVANDLIEFARLRHVTKLVIGKPFRSRLRDIFRGSLVYELVRRSGDIDVYVINGEPGELGEGADKTGRKKRRAWSPAGFSLALLVMVIVTAAAMALRRDEVSQVNISTMYLLAVAGVSALGRRGPALYAAFLGIVSFKVLFVPGWDLLSQEHFPSLLVIAAMAVIGLLISTLSVRLRQQVEASHQREARTAALHAVSRDLATSRGIENLLNAAVRHCMEVFACPVAILLPDDKRKLAVRGGDHSRCLPGSPDLVAAQWAYDHAQPAGRGTQTLMRVDAMHVPLVASGGTVGVVSLFVAHARQMDQPDRRNLLEAFAHQVALAVECDHLAVRAQTAQVEVETERLRNALLSSVSHDLRTPLHAITGAASSLVEQDHLLNDTARRDLAETIAEESGHLARLVSNLLDMTRLEGGGLNLKLVPHVLEDVVGAALTVLERRLQGRNVTVSIPSDVPPVQLDDILIQEVLVNLIDNAIKYTPADSPLEVAASLADKEVTVSVNDRGQGLLADELEKVFDKFYRGAHHSRKAGVGLGLAICKGIVTAHGGRIWAENRQGGGASFRFTLTVGSLPAKAAPDTAAMPSSAAMPGESVA